ncbi:MAG TPA: O-antigen ligase family protein [Armatimonadota bacterium]|jgi:hypothetical protein
MALCFFDGFIKAADPSRVSLFAKDVFLAIALLRWGYQNLRRRRWPSFALPFTVPMVLFVAYCGAEMFNTTTADPRVALAGVRTWIIWLPCAFLFYDYVVSRAQLQRLLVLVVGLGLLTGIYGIVQFRVGYGHLQGLGAGFAYYTTHFNVLGTDTVRAVSTFVSPGTFGAAMGSVVMLGTGAAAYLQRVPLKIFSGVTAAIALVGLGASASRAPLIGLVAGGFVLLVVARKPRLLALVIGIGFVFVVLVGSFAGGAFARRYNRELINSDTITSRFAIPLQHVWVSMLDEPLGVGVATGMGIGRSDADRTAYAPAASSELQASDEASGMVENEYARALRELGIPGALLFIWLIFKALQTFVRSYRRVRTTDYRILVGACLGLAVSIVLQLAVGSVLYLVPSGILFWGMAALCWKLPELEARELLTVTPAEPQPAAAPAIGR